MNQEKGIQITFIAPDFSKTVTATAGSTLLEVAHKNSVPLEGACEGGMICSTCHVIMDEEVYKKLPEASEGEDDTLDLAKHLTKNSRLGCQIKVEEYMDGMSVIIPSPCRNNR